MIKNIFTGESNRISFDVNSIYKGHHMMTYREIECLKCPFDYVMYQMIICEVKPDLIIEIGTNQGGSALYMADLMNSIGKGEIHTIDVDNRSNNISKQHSRIKFFHDGWGNYDVKLASGFKKILVIEDSSHEYKNTLNAIIRFAPLVTKGSYLIVEDGIANELGMKKRFQGGPLRALEEFMLLNRDFILDEKWLNMFGKNATFNIKGYLKKIV